mmetsp:Transcript_29455/g.43477  ORF Transcript_29455/g.43477 Transcript_29455/m.43477 type:complete len:146 (-) Transcript_29455:509-946(-)
MMKRTRKRSIALISSHSTPPVSTTGREMGNARVESVTKESAPINAVQQELLVRNRETASPRTVHSRQSEQMKQNAVHATPTAIIIQPAVDITANLPFPMESYVWETACASPISASIVVVPPQDFLLEAIALIQTIVLVLGVDFPM